MQPQKTLTKDIVVQNRSGIHARVSAVIVQTCKRFASEARLRTETAVADCRSIIDLLSLGARCGITVTLEITGEDAENLMNAITELFEARFNEDEESQ
ncbi:MAG: HPr family phosphocarrier protein [Planctomycetaceae bacterium]|jgi:phosphocarrier protein NPr|nr:HPr family phosphocarrier protein [Planctomycetaceae bacterium]